MDGSNWRWGPDDAHGDGPFWPPPPPPEDGPSGVIILLVVAVLVLGGLFLVHKLNDMIRIQACAIQGRTNCVPIDVPKRDVPHS